MGLPLLKTREDWSEADAFDTEMRVRGRKFSAAPRFQFLPETFGARLAATKLSYQAQRQLGNGYLPASKQTDGRSASRDAAGSYRSGGSCNVAWYSWATNGCC